MSKIIDAIPLPAVYYYAENSSYYRSDGERWIKINEGSAKNFVAKHAYLKTPTTTGTNSEVDECMLKIQSQHNVAYAGPLAGYDAGRYLMHGKQILVTDSPQFIIPKAGAWPTLDALFQGMFVDGELDQRPYFYGWVKTAVECFQQRHWKASQLLAMAGPVNSGKSLTQNLLTYMFGNRSAKPYQFMVGLTPFNGHTFCGEHQMLEDEAESVDIRSRRQFAAAIKTMLTGRDQNCHGKNKTPLILQPRWRMSSSLNDEAERLLVLPPLDNDIRDKIIILKTVNTPMPMPTERPEQEQAFWNQLISEIPAFLYYLKEYEIPETLRDSRYGIRAFQHPEIVAKLEGAAPEFRLLELIERELFNNGDGFRASDPWEGSAAQMESMLVRDNSNVQYEARKLLSWAAACGTYLSRLEDSTNARIQGRITSRTVNGTTIWTLRPPATTAA